MAPPLTAREIELLAAPSCTARTGTAAAGGGGRKRRGQRSARPRLSRRERRSVNDALLAHEPCTDAKSVFDVRPRAPTAFAALRDASALKQLCADAGASESTSGARVGRTVRALVKTKGAPVRAALRCIENIVREVRPGERVALQLGDSLSRLVAHCVAQFYGFMHRSEGEGCDRVLYVSSPVAGRKLPPVRLIDILL